MGKECFVIPRESLEKSGFIPKESGGQFTYTRIADLGELRSLLTVANSSGEYRERYGDQGVEEDPSYQQLVMYGFVARDDGKFLLYQRNEGANYAEARLAGKVSVGIGGHMEPTDFSLAQSFYRELDEEATVTVDGTPINFRNEEGNLNIPKMKEYVRLSPVGLIKDERDEVGKVHFGVVCRILPKGESIGIEVKTGDGEENVTSEYLDKATYELMLASGQVTPEGWADIVYREEIAPLGNK